MSEKLFDIIRATSSFLSPVPTGETPSLKFLPEIKSIIFDIYGTLIISASGDIGMAEGSSKSGYFLDALQKTGIKILDDSAGKIGLNYFYKEIQTSHTISIQEKISFPEVVITEVWEKTLVKLLDLGLIDTEITEEIILQVATYFECLTNPVWPMPDLVKSIRLLTKKGLKLGIISNAQFYTPLIFKALTNLSLEELGFDSELIQYSYKNKEAKPSSKMFYQIANNLKTFYNINPHETLYIGNDMLNDIYSAKKAGFKTVLFAGDARSLRFRRNNNFVNKENPDIIITELLQIIKLVTN